jgi:hypothetical protein
MDDLTAYFERYALPAEEKRAKLLKLVGEHRLDLDLDAGTARFNDTVVLPFQVLGTESENTLTWLWAWADEQTEMPEGLLRSSRAMKIWFETKGLGGYASPSIDLNKADGTQLAVVSSEVCMASAYYREHYEGGSILLLLFGVVIDRQPPFTRSELVRALSDLIAQYDFDHRSALTAYFQAKHLPFSSEGSLLSGELASRERLVAAFDERGRVTTINGEPFPPDATPR